MPDTIETLKVREIRKKYEKGDVTVHKWMSPRSNESLHSPTRLTNHFGKNNSGKPLGDEEVLWGEDLDERLHFLVGRTDTKTLLVKNVKCRIEVL